MNEVIPSNMVNKTRNNNVFPTFIETIIMIIVIDKCHTKDFILLHWW
jgi:hypothetical protein